MTVYKIYMGYVNTHSNNKYFLQYRPESFKIIQNAPS